MQIFNKRHDGRSGALIKFIHGNLNNNAGIRNYATCACVWEGR